MRTGFSAKRSYCTAVDRKDQRLPRGIPAAQGPVLRVSSGFSAQRLAVAEPEVPVLLCSCVRLGCNAAQSDQSYANGNQMGRESPVDYRRRREACVFMYACGDLGPLSFPPFSRPPLSQTNGSCQVCCLHAPFIWARCDLTDFEINCQSQNVP